MCNEKEPMITKAEFESAYKKFAISKAELFFMKYFSIHSIHNKVPAELLFITILVAPLMFAIVGEILDLSKTLTYIPSFIYAGFLAVIGILMALMWYKKRKRIEKIRKYLGISQRHFDMIIKSYYYNRYNHTDQYLKYNSTNKSVKK